MIKHDKLLVAVVQTAAECQLRSTANKIISFIDKAKGYGCRVVVFPESMLQSATEDGKSEIDQAIDLIKQSAAENNIYVIFGLKYRYSNVEELHDQALVIGPCGELIQVYDKVWSHYKSNCIPGLFEIDGIPCCAALCADRWLRGIEELPVFKGARILFELSDNYQDEWIPDLGWFWYVPRALRNSAFVVFANTPRARPVEEFKGHGPGHGHSAIIAPDGRPLAAAGEESDRILIAKLDLRAASLNEAEERYRHPALKEFWDIGTGILNGKKIEPQEYMVPDVPEKDIMIAAAQMLCSGNIEDNTAAMLRMIKEAGDNRADMIVFPELAVTGTCNEDVLNADESLLSSVLEEFKAVARLSKIHVAFGMPYMNDGKRWNCAYVIGPDGELLTRHEELNPSAHDIFEKGISTRSMWFQLKGVPCVITLGREALWSELAELAAVHGARIHVHIANNRDTSEAGMMLMRQLFLNLASYRTFTVTVNAASPCTPDKPGFPAGGWSAVWQDFNRFGLRNSGLGYIGAAPYSAERIKEAGADEEILFAVQHIKGKNAHFEEISRICPCMREWYVSGSNAVFK